MGKKLEEIRMLSIVTHAMIGIELVTIPINAVKYAKNDAWLCPFLSSSFVGIACLLGFWICSKYPGLNFAEINEKLYGKFFGKLSISINIIYNIFINGISLRFFGESIKIFLLENTPISVIMLVFLVVMGYIIMMDLETISIVFDILLPILLIFIFFILVISTKAITFYNLYPPLYHGFMPVIKGALSTMNPAGAAFIFAFILPQFSNPEKTKKFVFMGISIATIVYSIILALCIMVFGAEEIDYLLFPTLTLSKAVQFEVQIFERAESLFMAAWIPNTLTTLVVYFMISTISAKALFNTKKDGLIKLLQLPIIFTIALLPKNVTEVFSLLNYANIGLIFLNFGYVPFVALSVLIKKGLGKNENK